MSLSYPLLYFYIFSPLICPVLFSLVLALPFETHRFPPYCNFCKTESGNETAIWCGFHLPRRKRLGFFLHGLAKDQTTGLSSADELGSLDMERGCVRELDLRKCGPGSVAERVGFNPGLRSSAGKFSTSCLVTFRLVPGRLVCSYFLVSVRWGLCARPLPGLSHRLT